MVNTHTSTTQDGSSTSQAGAQRGQVMPSHSQAGSTAGQATTSQPTPPTSYHIAYIEGPKMDWTFDVRLYKSFQTWKLKCDNILRVELAHLPDSMKCKKVIT